MICALMLSKTKLMFRASALLPFARLPFASQSVFGMVCLQLNWRHSPVDCNPSHDGDNTVFRLAAVNIEQHFECASCHTRFLIAKLNVNELYHESHPKPQVAGFDAMC